MKMTVVLILISSLLFVVCQAAVIPVGNYLKVSEHCGTLNQGNAIPVGAEVTISSNLHVEADFKCAGNVKISMNQIDKSNKQSSQKLYYPGDTNGNKKTDCFFKQLNSNVYVVEVDVYWGFQNGTLMKNYEADTITCNLSNNRISGKTVRLNAIAMKNSKVQFGTGFSGKHSLKMVDVLHNNITDTNIPEDKKIQLQLSATHSTSTLAPILTGLKPYNCYAKNSATDKKYRMIKAGCGDGVLLQKDEGFTINGTTVTSPYFKLFELLQFINDPKEIVYSCDFVVCQEDKCGLSSCNKMKTTR